MSELCMNSQFYNIEHKVSHIATQEYMLHANTFHEIYYFVQGDVDFQLGGIKYEMEPDMLILIPPTVLHGICVHSPRPYERYTIHFDAELLSAQRRTALLRAFPDPSSPALGVWKGAKIGRVKRQIALLDSCQDPDEQMQQTLVPILLEAILAQVLSLCTASDRTLSAPIYSPTSVKNETIDYIDHNFTKPITLESLSKSLFLSKSQLNNICRKATGTTVMDYILRKRVVYARQMLAIGCAAAQACDLAGFCDYTSFYRAYVKYIGHPPKQDKRGSVVADPLERGMQDAKGSSSQREPAVRKQEPMLPERSKIVVVGQDPTTLRD